MKYLAAYPAALRAQVEKLLAEGKLGDWLQKRYVAPHEIRTDRALYDYVSDLKSEFLRNAEPLSKVVFDNKLHVIRNALGTHTTVSRVQGGKLKAKREIRVASLFKEVPIEWLRMIVVHELAHMKEREHDKAFYKLCMHMEPDYHQHEFDLRLYLTHLDGGGERLWTPSV
ncbi:M48 family metallopeptidase [Variovorax sp. J31P207]|uniref:YgjP-like metallopeptidase domain-containing protein n=1 Tax=Variovorax sp. J31P207 TaxID=3053510 RepID=UPI002575A91A|nr:M48 family metallopeptidase [Variovorax sp. J31P207]MDM0070820.1 M48 family metallopeptidase [Variovorax sp. J31P207]